MRHALHASHDAFTSVRIHVNVSTNRVNQKPKTKNTVQNGVLSYSRICVWEREQPGSDPARQRPKPGSDHAREVRLMVKKVLL